MDLLTFAGACGLVFVGLTGQGPTWQQHCRPAPPSFTATAPVATPPWPASSLDRWGGYVTEAATRFGLPAGWIRSVMQAESGGEPASTSPAGAMGLMQVMPDTYDDLRQRYGLGGDPYDPRDNILAGAAYLREMYDAFGAPDFLAAYNAGPQRLADHRATARPLPAETRHYVAELAPQIAQTPPPAPALPAHGEGLKAAPTPGSAALPEPPHPPRLDAAPAPPIPDGGSLFFTPKKPAAAPPDRPRSDPAAVHANP